MHKIKSFEDIFSQNMLAALFSHKQPAIANAVSGGIDSLSLLKLTIRWISNLEDKFRSKFVIHVLTVDHNLRPESLSEAKFVTELCSEFKSQYNIHIKHDILTWRRSHDVTSDIQAKAREARYELMTDYCHRHDILTLMTGHHDDDRIENFFIRLSKASGIAGLSDHNSHYINNVKILRPLYGFYRKDLEYILNFFKIKHMEDPSNGLPKFFRNQLRLKLQSFLEFNSLSSDQFSKRIITSINNLSVTEEHINKSLLELLSKVCISPLGWVRFNMCSQTDDFLMAILMSHLLTMVSGNNSLPRNLNVQTLLSNLKHSTKLKFTLHDCIIERKREYIIIYKEFYKILDAQMVFNDIIYWDNRFKILKTSDEDTKLNLSITRLSQKDYILNKTQIRMASKLPINIILTLPVFKDIENVIAIPHISYYKDEKIMKYIKNNLFIYFKPNFFSRLTHYII